MDRIQLKCIFVHMCLSGITVLPSRCSVVYSCVLLCDLTVYFNIP